MTPVGLKQLISDEGVRLTVYDDATGLPIVPGTRVIGHPTIGIGRALDVRGITAAETAYLLNNDMLDFTKSLLATYPWFARLTPTRQDVLTNMAFNLGPTGFAGFRKMLAALVAGDYFKAAEEILDSKAARQLPARYERLANAMALNSYVDPLTPR